jgi:hypothetical protein
VGYSTGRRLTLRQLSGYAEVGEAVARGTGEGKRADWAFVVGPVACDAVSAMALGRIEGLHWLVRLWVWVGLCLV